MTEIHIEATRLEVSLLPWDDRNHRYFTVYVERTRGGWAVHDGFAGYDADGTPHGGETHRHPLADRDAALALAARLAPDVTCNGFTAAEWQRRTQPSPEEES
ncbi:hypothetical protein [Streptomyces sp. NPDC001054]